MVKITLLALFLTTSVFANERIRPADQLLDEGYQPAPKAMLNTSATLPASHSLSWPVKFQDNEHSVANAMAQYQPFGDPYFHGGCDLRVKALEEIHSPVDGKLEAGHYSYSTNPDGSMEKFWKPWPQQGDRTYFEVAVVTDDGIRYEFHHVNRPSLPAEIVRMLNAGGGRVTKGMLVGQAIVWPGGDYHHVHYNIILPNGIRVNPEYVSPLLADHEAPTLLHAFAVARSGGALDFGNGEFSAVDEFVLHVVDKYDGSVYDHPPAFVRLQFESGETVMWDFRQTLTGADGKFPPLWDFLKESISSGNRTYYTDGGYGEGASLVRIKVPMSAHGKFTIDVADMAGNILILKSFWQIHGVSIATQNCNSNEN